MPGRKVLALIAEDPQYARFYDACNWPDPPSERLRGDEHFVNLSRDASGLAGDPCPTFSLCVVTAISQDAARLANETSTAERVKFLKYLGHWVGDVHQPLHVSFRDDLGGNNLRESGPCTGHLHRVWDSCILSRGLGNDVEAIAKALLDAAGHILADVIPGGKAAWISSDPIDWAEESFQIAIDPCTASKNPVAVGTPSITNPGGSLKRSGGCRRIRPTWPRTSIR